MLVSASTFIFFFFFNDTATTEIYTLSLHDALPISGRSNVSASSSSAPTRAPSRWRKTAPSSRRRRSEEHTSELQSRRDLVCRLLLEKKKKTQIYCPLLQRKDSSSSVVHKCRRHRVA